MQTFDIPWISYFIYDHTKDCLMIYLSDREKEKTPLLHDPITIEGDKIKEFIHKYDYRKLMYFSQHPLIQPFDTLLRMRWHTDMSFIRTQAICQSNPKGFNCVLVEDRVLHQLYPDWLHEHTHGGMTTLQHHFMDRYASEKEWKSLESHLTHLLKKR